jgi:hypothetical protein
MRPGLGLAGIWKNPSQTPFFGPPPAGIGSAPREKEERGEEREGREGKRKGKKRGEKEKFT